MLDKANLTVLGVNMSMYVRHFITLLVWDISSMNILIPVTKQLLQ